MADVPQTIDRFTIICRRCDRPIMARSHWIGWEVRCPHCSSQLCVPEMPLDGRTVPANGPYLGSKFVFNFACPRCDCLLEAHTGMPGNLASCPTCAARFTVPHLNERSGRPRKAELVEADDQNPTPVHAYGASGVEAPSIIKMADDTYAIQCPHCNAYNEIDADQCGECGTPFTIDAAATGGQIASDRWVNYSIALGVIGLFAFPLFIPGLLATWWGGRAVMSPRGGSRALLGLVGLFLGVVSLAGGVVFWYFKLK